jgi:flagellar basal-body rod modification protein FlgD
MDVAATAAAAEPATSAQKAAKSASLDYNAFLKLLIAEMRNQDPTEPMDATQYMAQLASFSTVEQAIQTNAKLDALLTSTALAQAEGLIGRTVTSADGAVSGRVASLTIAQGAAVAILEGGDRLPLGEGIVVSQ